MIMNNAAQQPDDFVYQGISLPENKTDIRFSADSMAYFFCMSLGNAMTQSPLFDDVRLCTDTLRRDSVFLISRPFSPGNVVSFCEEYEVDALITLDKMYFKPVLQKNYANFLLDEQYISILIIGELRAVYPDSQVAHTIPFSDSLVLSSDEFFSIEPVKFTSQDVMAAMRSLSEYTGEQIHVHFVPHWVDDTRWFYTSLASDWKRASVYALSDKWEVATNEWKALFDKTSKWKRKAFLASNLALCHELAGDFQKAIEYAEIADSLFVKFASEDTKYRKWQHEYLELLHIRVENDNTLSQQLRE